MADKKTGWFSEGMRANNMPNIKPGEQLVNLAERQASKSPDVKKEGEVSDKQLKALRGEIESMIGELAKKNQNDPHKLWEAEQLATIEGIYRSHKTEDPDIARHYIHQKLTLLRPRLQALLTQPPNISQAIPNQELPSPQPESVSNPEADGPIRWDNPTDGAEAIFYRLKTVPDEQTRVTWLIPPTRIGKRSVYEKGKKDEFGHLLYNIIFNSNPRQKKPQTLDDAYLEMKRVLGIDEDVPPPTDARQIIADTERELGTVRAEQPGNFMPPKQEDVAPTLSTVGDSSTQSDDIVGGEEAIDAQKFLEDLRKSLSKYD